MRLALYQPDIAQNTGAMLRLGACLGVPVDIIEPCGFIMDETRLKRVAMDYIDHVEKTHHSSWDAFKKQVGPGRIILLTTKASVPYTDFSYRTDDVLLVGRESAGVPDDIHESADAKVAIPMNGGVRSLNVAMAAAIVLSEALRQNHLRQARQEQL
jgi:tRNA (cytidine/uridine-2'-O-)-methyltransferase